MKLLMKKKLIINYQIQFVIIIYKRPPSFINYNHPGIRDQQSSCKDQSQFGKVQLVISIFTINDYIMNSEGFKFEH